MYVYVFREVRLVAVPLVKDFDLGMPRFLVFLFVVGTFSNAPHPHSYGIRLGNACLIRLTEKLKNPENRRRDTGVHI